MRWLNTLTMRLRSLFGRSRVEDELDAELQFHLEQQMAEHCAAGLNTEAARAAALRSMGSLALVKDQCRDSLGLRVLDEIQQDVRYATRSGRKNLAFTIGAVLTLALGFGANTAIFSVARALLIQPLPYAESRRLMAITAAPQSQVTRPAPVSYPVFLDWQDQAQSFESMAAYVVAGSTLTGQREPIVPGCAAVTPNLFSLLHVAPLLGRTLRASDADAGAPSVVVISEPLWAEHFGHDPRVIGQPVTLDGATYTVVGVMSSSFQFPHINPVPQLWMPLTHFQPFQPLLAIRAAPLLSVLGRLKPGVQQGDAQAEMDVVRARLAQAYPDTDASRVVQIIGLQKQIVGGTRSSVLLLLGGVGLLLLIACTNVASLQLAKAIGREREMAIRAALGAGRGRLARQVLVENVLLAVAGGGVGIVLAHVELQALLALISPDLPQIRAVGIDRWVLAYTFALACVTGLLVGLVPLAGGSWIGRPPALHDATRGATLGPRRRRLQGVLVVTEIATAVVMLTGAGLLLQSLLRLQGVNPGFNAVRLLTGTISLPQWLYTRPDQWRSFNAGLLERIRQAPGVDAAAFGVGVPFIAVPFTIPFAVQGVPPTQAQEQRSTQVVETGGDYFRVLGIPLIRGRAFAESDEGGSPHVGIVNATFARGVFGSRDPVGQTLILGQSQGIPLQIVGVVGDTSQASLGLPPPPLLYLPFSQRPFRMTTFLIRASTNPAALQGILRAEVARMDPTVPLLAVEPMAALLDRSMAASRYRTLVLTFLSGLALLLAAIGLYGVLAQTVASRTREIGVRAALGATRSDVMALILGQGLTLTGFGVLLGLAGATAVTRYLAGLLYGVAPLDPVTFVVVSVTLAAVATLASYVPARRATRVDPLIALRSE